MEDQAKKISAKINSAKRKKEIKLLLKELESLLGKNEKNKEILHLRAQLYIKIEEPSKAINDYNEILTIDPEDQTSLFQVEHLKTILRFRNTDIYANPNTSHDPWLD